MPKSARAFLALAITSLAALGASLGASAAAPSVWDKAKRLTGAGGDRGSQLTIVIARLRGAFPGAWPW